MVVNAFKTWVKQSSPWEERWFVKCNEKLCKLLRRFLQLNNNIKPSLSESLGFLRYNFPPQKKKKKFKKKVLRTNLLAKILGSQQTMVVNAFKTWVKQSSPWEERWFVKCNEKLCKLLRRFLQLNNNIKPSLSESLGFLRYNFPPQKKKKKFKKKVLRTNLLAKILGSQQTMVANAFKTWVKQISRWEKRWFVKCSEKLCELPRRFLLTYFIYLSLNNNIKNTFIW